MILPYAFTATPEDPTTCGNCGLKKDHGDFIDALLRPADVVSMRVAVLICAACVADFDTALTEHSRKRTNPELFTKEARNA